MNKFFSDVLTIVNGKNQRAVENPNGKYPIYGSGGIMGYADNYLCDAETVIIGRKGSINKPLFVEEPFWNVDTAFGLVANKTVLLPKYLFYFCVNYDFEKLNKTVTIPSLTKSDLLKIEIDIPSIIFQQSVVEKLDRVGSCIELLKMQLQKLNELIKSRFVEMFGNIELNNNNYPVYLLNDLCNISSSKRIYQSEQSKSGVPFLRVSDLVKLIETDIFDNDLFIPIETFEELQENDLVPTEGDILVTSRGTIGKCYIMKKSDRFYFQDGMISWLYSFDKRITPLFLSLLFDSRYIKRQVDNLQSGSTVAYLSIAMLKKLHVVVPPIDLQNQFGDFVTRVEKQKAVVQQSIDKLETLKKSLMQEYFG